jgi:hypothetical protein
MNQLQEKEGRTFCQSWWQIVSSLLECQWKLVERQYRVSLQLLEGAWRAAPGTGGRPALPAVTTSPNAARLPSLEQFAVERVRHGLAPPKEVYETPYRERIDWSQFPGWARPIDPELFQGCGHEG